MARFARAPNSWISFPVFVKPRTGSGSVGARKIDTPELLKQVTEQDESLIIQELMTGQDLDADVYVDTVSHKPVAIFSKRKLSTTIGGANKTISFKDDNLFGFVQKVMSVLRFNGPLDMDFFYQNGQYYLSEINPRFGGAYLHAYGAGVDFESVLHNGHNGRHGGKGQHNAQQQQYHIVGLGEKGFYLVPENGSLACTEGCRLAHGFLLFSVGFFKKGLSKHCVIPSQCAHWRGNPPDFQTFSVGNPGFHP